MVVFSTVFAILIQLHYCSINTNPYILKLNGEYVNRGKTNMNKGMIVAVVIIFHSRLHITAEH